MIDQVKKWRDLISCQSDDVGDVIPDGLELFLEENYQDVLGVYEGDPLTIKTALAVIDCWLEKNNGMD